MDACGAAQGVHSREAGMAFDLLSMPCEFIDADLRLHRAGYAQTKSVLMRLWAPISIGDLKK
jgi:hypothetical protein